MWYARPDFYSYPGMTLNKTIEMMTQENLQTADPTNWAYDLDKAIDGAVAAEARRQRHKSIIEEAHNQTQEILKAAFTSLIKLQLPESFLEALNYEVRGGANVYGCSCRLLYRDIEIFISIPGHTLSDWRITSYSAESEFCSSPHLLRTILLYLAHLRSTQNIPFADALDDEDGDDDDAIKGVYFA